MSNFLDEWDPLGIYLDADGPPPGEYDDLTWPLVRLLADGACPQVVADRLRALLASWYGVGCADAEAVGSRLHDWWNESNR